VLTLSHWSSDRLARFPPFCMCLILDSPAPVTPNILYLVSIRRHHQRAIRRWAHGEDDPVGNESFEGDGHRDGGSVAIGLAV
jgi:hypothetical protein